MDTSDRSALIRLAASLPKGDHSRRIILSSLTVQASDFRVGQKVKAKKDTYIGVGRDAVFVNAGTVASITDEGEDEDGVFFFLTIVRNPGQYADDQRPYKVKQAVSEDTLRDNWERA